MSYTIHPDIKKAQTLPGKAYHDPDFFESQKEGLFSSAWQWYGAYPEAKGHYPFTCLPHYFNEPLLLNKPDATHPPSILSNVCTHRGSLLLKTACQSRHIKCPYHGRVFDSQGQFLHMPEFDLVEGFPSQEDHLTQIKSALYKNFLFYNLSQGTPIDFQDWISPVKEMLGFLDFEQFKQTETKNYDIDINWMLYCENYLEGFHIPYVHPDLNESLDIKNYKTLLYPQAVLQVGGAKSNDIAFNLPQNHPFSGQGIAAFYFWLFPNLMLNFYPWGLSVNKVEPHTLNKTRITYETFVFDPNLLHLGAGADLSLVELEDQAILKKVQAGTQSRFYRAGRYSPTQEQGVHLFHRLLTEDRSL